jgi:hypothetical protein
LTPASGLIAARRQRIGSEAAKDTSKHRAATAECINAQARNRHLTRLLGAASPG